jgi:transposase-like protein
LGIGDFPDARDVPIASSILQPQVIIIGAPRHLGFYGHRIGFYRLLGAQKAKKSLGKPMECTPKVRQEKARQFSGRELMRKRKPRDYASETKVAAVERVEKGERADDVARSLGVPRSQIYVWRAVYRARGAAGFRPRGRPRRETWSEGGAAAEGTDPPARAARRVAELERKVGQQQLELDFFRRALRQVEALSQPKDGPGATASTPSSKR